MHLRMAGAGLAGMLLSISRKNWKMLMQKLYSSAGLGIVKGQVNSSYIEILELLLSLAGAPVSSL